MQKKLIVESRQSANTDELVQTFMAISIVSKKLASRVKEVNKVKEENPSGKERRIVIHYS